MGDSGSGGRGHRLVSVRALTLVLTAVWLTALVGCSSQPRYQRHTGPPPASYTVRKGDTLYGISFRYNLDYRSVARWNGIRPPYRIYPGQRIRLYPPKTVKNPARHRVASAHSASRAKPRSTSARAARRISSPPRAHSGSRRTRGPAGDTSTASSALRWQWPTQGTLLRRFAADGPGRKGIDIAGRTGQPVRAAADGVVVYAGSGLRGYGELIIIKHNNTYLSAYAHNRRLLVKEGERVRRGQKIAELGSSGTDRPKLHFEIRRHGKPVDPLRYLPHK